MVCRASRGLIDWMPDTRPFGRLSGMMGICRVFALIAMMILTTDAKAVILCQPDFICPIVRRALSLNGVGSDYTYGSPRWHTWGPWSTDGYDRWLTIYGISRCSITNGIYLDIGNPVATTGNNAVYCWCRIEDGGAWVLLYEYEKTFECGNYCTNRCATRFEDNAEFRAAACVPAQSLSFPSDYRVGETSCPAGYVQVTSGVFDGGNFTDAKGSFDVHCREY
jgi:hypothetical protein